MEKSISNRFYFDYNATSPLAKKVTNFLPNGDFLFGNPSSLHTQGKNAKKVINETSHFLYSLFQLKESDYYLYFHSGATESINTIFKGNAFSLFKQKKKAAFFFSQVDHAAVVQCKDDLEAFGHDVYFFNVDKNGNFNCEDLISQMKSCSSKGEQLFLNYTYVNNESGIVWPLSEVIKIKNETSCYVHVDAVQVVGKIYNWHQLSSDLDSYTFSGHKFGSLKGIGFSFIKKNSLFEPLIKGGNQQNGMRSGTQNALGIYSLKLALEEMVALFNPDELKIAKEKMEMELMKHIHDRGEIVGLKNNNRNLNTIFLVMFGQKAEILSAKFDLQGIDVSTGSACSSGVIKENRILMSMGYSFDDSRSSIRLSFSPFMKLEETDLYLDKIKKILN